MPSFLHLLLFFWLLEFLTPEVCSPRSELIPVVSSFKPLAFIANVTTLSQDCHFVSSGFYNTTPSNVSIFAQCRESGKEGARRGPLKIFNVPTGSLTPFLPDVAFSYKIVMLSNGGRLDFTFRETSRGVSYIFRELNKAGTVTHKFDYLGGADMNNMFYDEKTKNICFISKLNMCFFNRSVDVMCGNNLKELEAKAISRKTWFAEYASHSHQSAKLIRKKDLNLTKYVPVWKKFDRKVTIGSTFGLTYFYNSSDFKKGGDSTQISGRVPDVYTLSIFKKRNETHYGLVYLHDGLEGYPKLMRPFLYCANSTHFVISQNLILNADYFKYMMITCADGVIGQTIYCTGVNPAHNPTRENRVWYKHDKVLLTIQVPTLQNFENYCFSQTFTGTVIKDTSQINS